MAYNGTLNFSQDFADASWVVQITDGELVSVFRNKEDVTRAFLDLDVSGIYNDTSVGRDVQIERILTKLQAEYATKFKPRDDVSVDRLPPQLLNDPVSVDPTAAAGALQSVAQHAQNAALACVNVTNPPALRQGPRLPPLPVQTVEGYARGSPLQVQVVTIDGFQIEENTAKDFILMRNAAAKDGIILHIVSAFRSMELQTRMYSERFNSDGSLTAEGLKWGPAAKPGWSNHQSGVALDIETGMTIADRLAGRRSAIFAWLQTHAATYGFDNDDIPPKQPEPWHWRHKEKRFVAETLIDSVLATDYYAQLVDSSEAAKAAMRRGSLSKVAYDKVRAYERSVKIANSSRDTLINQNAAEKLGTSADINKTAAQMTQTAVKADQEYPAYTAGSLNALVYNFETGRWGEDGKGDVV
jgi:hypothetical protein